MHQPGGAVARAVSRPRCRGRSHHPGDCAAVAAAGRAFPQPTPPARLGQRTDASVGTVRDIPIAGFIREILLTILSHSKVRTALIACPESSSPVFTKLLIPSHGDSTPSSYCRKSPVSRVCV